jgi:type 1 glutamine amidotransferase
MDIKMKHLLSLLFASMLTLTLASAFAQDQAAPKRERKPVRVLLTYGGHGFQEKDFFAMWGGFKGISYEKCKLPEQADMLKPGLEKQFDVIVTYDMNKDLTPAQQKNLTDLLNTGIGYVATHHNICANAGWPEYRKIIGGKYLQTPETIDGKECPKSSYDHDLEMKISVAEAKHPITRRMSDFTIHDEGYGNCYVAPGVRVLLTTDNPKATRQIAWVTRYGKSPVFYLMLGHDAKAWASPQYRELLVRGIRWAARESKGEGPAMKGERQAARAERQANKGERKSRKKAEQQ